MFRHDTKFIDQAVRSELLSDGEAGVQCLISWCSNIFHFTLHRLVRFLPQHENLDLLSKHSNIQVVLENQRPLHVLEAVNMRTNMSNNEQGLSLVHLDDATHFAATRDNAKFLDLVAGKRVNHGSFSSSHQAKSVFRFGQKGSDRVPWPLRPHYEFQSHKMRHIALLFVLFSILLWKTLQPACHKSSASSTSTSTSRHFRLQCKWEASVVEEGEWGPL